MTDLKRTFGIAASSYTLCNFRSSSGTELPFVLGDDSILNSGTIFLDPNSLQSGTYTGPVTIAGDITSTGTYSGDGSGLTNLNPASGPSAGNVVSLYSSTTQIVSVSGSFQPVFMGNINALAGWTLDSSSKTIVCPASGTYYIGIHGHVQKTSGGNSTIEIVGSLSGTIVAASGIVTTVTSNAVIQNFSTTLIGSLPASGTIQILWTGNTIQSQLISFNGVSGTVPCFGLNIHRIG